MQLQLSYDDYDGTLNIHVIQARGLRARDKNGFSDPFVKVYLLPGRTQLMGFFIYSADNKRRTKSIPRTLDPEWHQTLVFMKISRDELHSKTMEVTVWDYDRFKPNDFLGEVLLDLSDNTFLDNKPHWYRLHPHSKGHASIAPKPRTLSPPNSSSSSTSHQSRAPTARVQHRSRDPASQGQRGRSAQPASRERSSSNQRQRDHHGAAPQQQDQQRPEQQRSHQQPRRLKEHGQPRNQPDPRGQRRPRSRDPSPSQHNQPASNLRPVRFPY
uniref:C2 domain-containing protein n=1 Tax=Capitella teleta TaxID=283909 RepID=X1Z4G7_CAPTE